MSRNKLALACFLSLALHGCVSAPEFEGPISDNYDGKRFFNRLSVRHTAFDLMKVGFGFAFQAPSWPEIIKSAKTQPSLLLAPSSQEEQFAITFINHSSLLIQAYGVNILTDPIFSERASPFTFAGPKRVRPPGVELKSLPKIDVVLISHNHYDHLDLATLKQLVAHNQSLGGHEPVILSGLGNSLLYDQENLSSYRDMDWDQSFHVRDLAFTFTEARHRSGRGLFDQMGTLWGSFVIKSPKGSIYFAGDTGYSDHFKDTGESYGPFRMALLPIGAYEPRWFMKDVHLNPKDAAIVHKDIKSQESIGIHFGTFQLTYEAIDQPLKELDQALASLRIPKSDFYTLNFGETRLYSWSKTKDLIAH